MIFWWLMGLTQAETFSEMTQGLNPGMNRNWSIHGYQRIRNTGYYNLDLDRGLTTSGQPIFPVAPSGSQWLTTADMRFRGDVSGTSERGSVAVKLQFDVLDNIRLGSIPVGTPLDTTSQLTPEDSIQIRQAYATALTPLGFVIAGRMTTQWGLGMLVNDGMCIDCNTVDVSDRVGFITALGGHLWTISYDYSSVGQGVSRAYNVPDIDWDPSDNANTWTVAVMDVLSDFSRNRRRRGGRTSVEYGAYGSLRNQQNDNPSSYLLENTRQVDVLVPRDYRALATDGWIRVTAPQWDLGLELAYLDATIGNASLLPGVQSNLSVGSQQWGLALESNLHSQDGRWRGGLNAGAASGDAAPGMGGRAVSTYSAAQTGDLEGAQYSLPDDLMVNNFRFHADYRVDRILWREIVGTVTDALYIRPHLSWEVAEAGPGRLTLHQAIVYSQALQPTSTLSGSAPLGIEWDPSIEYTSTDGMGFQIDYALLLPLSGLDNVVEGLDAQPAHLIRSHLRYRF